MSKIKDQSVSPPGFAKRKLVTVSPGETVSLAPLSSAKPIPFAIQPTVDGVDLVTWSTANRELIDSLLLTHRALLFRGFNIRSATELHRFIEVSSDGRLLEYKDRSSPRHEVAEKIYTSTDYPADQRINLHNEGTYWSSWPLKIYFCCLLAPSQGGATPIADCRSILQRISPEVRERFMQKNVMYVRNYNDGFGLTWQAAFQTTERAEVEKHCRRNSIEFVWKGGERLRTRHVRQAVAVCPRTKESVWFNHAAFFHVSSLDEPLRGKLLAEFAEEDLPFNTYYGDGAPIEPYVLDELRAAYREELVVFPWQKGDVLLLDNMTIAHGREPFVGERVVIAGMADPYSPDSENKGS